MKTIKNFLQIKSHNILVNDFSVYRVDSNFNCPKIFNEHKYFKIFLLKGQFFINICKNKMKVDGTVLLFESMKNKYYIDVLSKQYDGYVCLFTEKFISTNNVSESFQDSSFINFKKSAVFNLNDFQTIQFSNIFKKLLHEFNTSYVFRDDLCKIYINILIYEALKL